MEEQAIGAKELLEQVNALSVRDDGSFDGVKFVSILSGVMAETLLEYEEPDVVMEQTFHRMAELMKVQPLGGIPDDGVLPAAWKLDEDIEAGRRLAKKLSETMPKSLDDVHEIVLGIAMSEFFADRLGLSPHIAFQIMIEVVIRALMTEMAAQELCDGLIEEFIDDGWPLTRAIEALAAATGIYVSKAVDAEPVKIQHILPDILRLIAVETQRFGLKGGEDWWLLGPANDVRVDELQPYVEELIVGPKEFFDSMGLESDFVKVVALGKATGRMIAASTHKDVAQMQLNVAKSLAKSGLISGAAMDIAGI